MEHKDTELFSVLYLISVYLCFTFHLYQLILNCQFFTFTPPKKLLATMWRVGACGAAVCVV